MADFTQGDLRPVLQQSDIAPYQKNGSLVLDSRRTRPLWFDGRFLAAHDLEREQDYFLQRQADLGRAPGFGVLRGLLVRAVSTNGQTSDIITIAAGQGITPAGEQVVVPSNVTIHLSTLALQLDLDLQLGIATTPGPAPADRTGLFAIVLQPVQYAANPITSFPTTIQGTRTTQDGDMVQATSIALVPYPNPINSNDPATLQAAITRQIFLSGNGSELPDSLLPVALVNLQNGMVQWLDTYMLRRELGVEFGGVRFGLTDPATQQAYLQQFDSQLQQVVNTFLRQNLSANFAASNYFQSLPPAGRFPLASINTDGFTQNFFPPQMDVRLSIIPEDEIAGLLEDSLSLPPIDLTLDAGAYSNLTVFAMIPVPRAGFFALANGLPQVPITSTIPQVLANRLPVDLLRFYQGATGFVAAPAAANTSWQAAIGAQTYGFYIRRRSSANASPFASPGPPVTATTTTTSVTAAPTTARPTTTTTTPPPTTTTAPPPTTTTTPPPTTTTTPRPTTTTSAPPTTTTTTTTTTTPAPTSTPRATLTLRPPTTIPFTLIPTTIPFTIVPLTTPPLTIRPPLTVAPFTLPPSTVAPVVRATRAKAPLKPKTKPGTATARSKPKKK